MNTSEDYILIGNILGQTIFQIIGFFIMIYIVIALVKHFIYK